MSKVSEFRTDNLVVSVYGTREDLGCAAAEDVEKQIRAIGVKQEEIRIMFASAQSQRDLWNELSKRREIPWNCVTAFHMDEYLGLPEDAPQKSGHLLREEFFQGKGFRKIHYIDGSAHDERSECQRYASLLASAPLDIVCMGIGENGHIAFNDPPVADFSDLLMMKPVTIDKRSRQQQVNDGAFSVIDEVPVRALTATVPQLLAGEALFVVVPGERKAEAVWNTLFGPISLSCPASIIRTHRNAKLYLDRDSARMISRDFLSD
ncbi:MAG: glucosamine-6-phosphate deaminase [Ignavibacteria bacterium]|nr:glucosamine-6-phosphate deaminase [Ignavibacteria bacterium]